VKLVDHGPPAEDTEGCESFRQFWGDKSELRRFNDGRITESVVWELTGQSSNERFQIPSRIVRHIVERHLGIPAHDITIFDTKYDGLVSIPADVTARYSTLAPSTAPEAVQRMALTAFDELVKDIKAMENLPLSLVNAVPADESLRYSSCLPPIPLVSKALHSLPDCSKYIPTMEIVLQFEQSTRWPDDLEAIQKVKVALLDAVAQALLANGAPHAVVAWDGNNRPLEDHVALEVILASGFAFRARVQHDRERTLMERIISDKHGTSEYERKKAQAALERHTRHFISLPTHHAAVLSLQRRCPSYSHAVRLFKRWISAHWLSPHISTEAAELICAEVYLNPGAQESPCSGQAGFSRTIAFLTNWDFRESPIALPLYTVSGAEGSNRVGLPGEVLAKVQELFTGHISVDPALSHGAWTLATEQDYSGHMWTENVTALVASRVREVAKATMSYMNAGMAAGSLDTKVFSD
jgi:U3 small nucleolar RNA-associated protein 22